MESVKLLPALLMAFTLLFMKVPPYSQSAGLQKAPAQATTASVASAEQDISDCVSAPDAIVFHSGNKAIAVKKGKQFDKIVALANARLHGAKITSSSEWADFSVDPMLSGIDTLEFDYSKLQTSVFEYDGLHHSSPALNPGEKPPVVRAEINYTKLVFPLADQKSGSENSNKFSLSVLSYGDPNLSISINGKSGLPVFQEYPIGSPDSLSAYLTTLKQ